MPSATTRTRPAAAAPAPPAAAPKTAMRPDAWNGTRAVVAEKRLTFGRQYWIEAPPGVRAGFCKQKVFKLREDIRVWTGEDQTQEAWRLRTQKVLDFHAAFDLVDAAGRVVAHFRRRGWKSMFKPEWLVFDGQGRQMGTFTVDSGWMVFLRRQLPLGQILFPTKYHLRLDSARGPVETARAVERRRIWGNTFDVHVAPGASTDLRIPIALTILSAVFSESQGA